MKLSASIQLIWQLAGQETKTGEFEEIQPEHFCMALLKFAELPEAQIIKLGLGASAAGALVSEITSLRQVIADAGLDATRVRRGLRARLGKGGCPQHAGKIHRAQATREVFEAAARSAADAGTETLTASHLLTEVLRSPTPALAQVLEAVGARPGAPVGKPSRPSLLDKFGADLTALTAQGKLTAPAGCEVECKALVQSLSQKERKSVLLVGEAHDAGRDVVVAAACSWAVSKPAPPLNKQRIIEVRYPQAAGTRADEWLDAWEKLFAEAASAKEVVLLLPPLDEYEASSQVGEWQDLLKRIFEKRTVQCICRGSARAWDRWRRKDKRIERLVQVIWLQEETLKSVPREL